MKSPNTNPQSGAATKAGWLVFFFGLAYFTQHFAQAGLISQPLTFYLKEVLGFGPKAVTEYLAILTIPWMIKPLYGLISDFIPLFGYRRKSYLLLLNLLATGGFLAITGLTGANEIIFALVLTAFGTAMSDVIIDALMVELGQKTGQTKAFQAQQWLWFYTASIITSIAGGFFAQHFGPAQGLHYAALVTAAAPLTLLAASWFIVKEEKTKADLVQLKATAGSLWNAAKSKTLWIVIGFLAFWQFSPSFGTPQYYYMTDVLKFPQDFIGTLGAIGSVGSVIAALVYKKYLAPKYTTKQLLFASVGIGVIGTLSYLFLADNFAATWLAQIVDPKWTAMFLSFTIGGASLVAVLTVLNLAAEACPKRVEGLTFALLMSVYNLAAQGSSIIGGRLYEDWFNMSLTPLILVSAVATFLCIFLIPLLPKFNSAEEDNEAPGK
jgi:MFS family permease